MWPWRHTPVRGFDLSSLFFDVPAPRQTQTGCYEDRWTQFPCPDIRLRRISGLQARRRVTVHSECTCVCRRYVSSVSIWNAHFHVGPKFRRAVHRKHVSQLCCQSLVTVGMNITLANRTASDSGTPFVDPRGVVSRHISLFMVRQKLFALHLSCSQIWIACRILDNRACAVHSLLENFTHKGRCVQ